MKLKKTLILMLIILTPIVVAFGVSTPYYEGNPLIMSPGETRIVILTLQNMLGGENYTAVAEIIEGGEFAKLPEAEKTYRIPHGYDNVTIAVEITVPQKSRVGEKTIKVRVLVQPEDKSEGQLTFTQGVGAEIPVVIKAEKSLLKNLILIIGSITMLLIIYFLIRKSLKKRDMYRY